jgi:hypothetical protein
MNDEQIYIWKEVVVVASLMILYRYSPGENEKIEENTIQDNQRFEMDILQM